MQRSPLREGSRLAGLALALLWPWPDAVIVARRPSFSALRVRAVTAAYTPSPRTYVPAPKSGSTSRIPITPVPPGGVSTEDIQYVATHSPILTQEGLATWYTAPYKGRKSANGVVFDDYAMTAAHRTLPMGSLVG